MFPPGNVGPYSTRIKSVPTSSPTFTSTFFFTQTLGGVPNIPLDLRMSFECVNLPS